MRGMRVMDLFKQSDADRSGQISAEEFTVMLRPLASQMSCRGLADEIPTGEASSTHRGFMLDGLLKLAFDQVDVDCSGFITLGELRNRLKKASRLALQTKQRMKNEKQKQQNKQQKQQRQ